MNDYLPVLYFLKPRITRDLPINLLCTHVTSLVGFVGWLVAKPSVQSRASHRSNQSAIARRLCSLHQPASNIIIC